MKDATFPNFPNWLASKYPDVFITPGMRFRLQAFREEYEKELEQWELGD